MLQNSEGLKHIMKSQSVLSCPPPRVVSMGVNVTKGTHAASLHSYSDYNRLVRGVVCVLEKFHIAASFGASVSFVCMCVRACVY